MSYKINKRHKGNQMHGNFYKCNVDHLTKQDEVNIISLCESSAEIQLDSYMEVIRNETFWLEDFNIDHAVEDKQDNLEPKNYEEQIGDSDDDSDHGPDTTETHETEKPIDEPHGIKLYSEVVERRRKFVSACEEEKMKVLIQCVPLSRIAHGNYSLQYAEAHLNLAQAYLDWKKLFLQAAKYCKTAHSILEYLHNNESLKTNGYAYDNIQITRLRLFIVYGQVLVGTANFEEAESVSSTTSDFFYLLMFI